MTMEEIMQELEAYGNASVKKIFLTHGAREPFFGVKVEDLKKIQKKVKKDHELALRLYRTGNSDAMYLAGLIADPAVMTPAELDEWASAAYWYMLSEYTVAWVAAESPSGEATALRWIDSKMENIAAAGWATLASLVSIREDSSLDAALYIRLLDRVASSLHASPNRVRAAMNTFVIAAGGYAVPLSEHALTVADALGKVKVDMGGTACKVPGAREYILKMHARGWKGKKRKSARC
jgi:3-methyladenine DNA glycosylase AlkD